MDEFNNHIKRLENSKNILERLEIEENYNKRK
jgi:hypothetical protein